jgi:hypothetical protein
MDRRVIAVLAVGALAALWWLALALSAPAGSGPRGSDTGNAAVAAGGPKAPAAERHEVGASLTADATAAESTTPTGRIRVHVVTESGVPIAGCKCQLDDLEAMTDADGAATFVVMVGRRYLDVEPPPGSNREKVDGSQRVTAGQTVDVTVSLPLRVELAFCCRIVAAEDRQPIAGAMVVVSSGEERTITDSTGASQVVVDLSSDSLDVTARGRAPVRVAPETGHDTPATAMLVPLERGADLELTVVDAAARPVTECVLELRASPWGPRWPPVSDARGDLFRFGTDRIDDDGVLRLADLPVDTALSVYLRLPAGLLSPSTLPPLVLVPGLNTRRIVLEAPGRIVGHLLREDGSPLPEVRINVASASDGSDVHEYAETKSDGSFEGVIAPGTWIVGACVVAPEEAVRLPTGSRPHKSLGFLLPLGLAAPSLRVAVTPGLLVTAELRAQQEHVIAGRAIGPDDRPVPGVVVNAEREGRLLDAIRTDADGGFRIDRLLAGRLQLTTDNPENSLGLAAPVTVEAGEQSVTLRLEAIFGAVSGRVIDADSGTPAVAWVRARQRDGDDLGDHCDLDGGFVYRGLRPGIWDLVASDTRGCCAVIAGLQIVAGGELDHLQLALQPGAVLRPRHPDADEFVVVRGGDVIARDNLPDGAPGEARVLPGAWTVRFLHKDREIARRDVTVRAGDDVIVDGR